MSPTTIAYFTSRKEPCFEWAVDSLANQTSPEERANIQLLIIDRHAWFRGLFHGAKEHTEWIDLTDPKYHDPVRKKYVADCVAGRFPFLHLPPKPNVYCGPWRISSKDWFCAANARNTALLYAQHPYFVGVDDLSVLMPGWWNQVKHANEGGYVLCGAYKKVLDLNVIAGEVVSFTPFPPGVDSRWSRGSDTGIVPWFGNSLYGCSFGVPLDMALRVDGFDGACNALGAEDYDFGMRVERAGGRFYYNRNALTLESEERHHRDPTLPRESREVTNPAYLPREYTGNKMADHVLLNRLVRETARVTPLIPDRLIKQRQRLADDRMVNVPREPVDSWIDKRPLDSL